MGFRSVLVLDTKTENNYKKIENTYKNIKNQSKFYIP